MKLVHWCGCLLSVALLASACASKEKPLTRSPSLDYRTDQPRTADGRVIGADGIDPKDRLAASAKAGSEGSELAPGWYVEDGKLKYDPERRDDQDAHEDNEDKAKKKKKALPPADGAAP